MNQVSLKEELKGIGGRMRKFILLRIADTDAETARGITNIPKGTYNSWFKNADFVRVYQKMTDLSVEYKQEAIQLLRRTTQLQAALLEEQIVQKMKAEIESGEYNLIKTLLARSVYDKIINSLDYQPESLSLSWEQRLQQFYSQPQITEGENATVLEAAYSQQNQHQKSLPESVSEQEPLPDSEEVQA